MISAPRRRGFLCHYVDSHFRQGKRCGNGELIWVLSLLAIAVVLLATGKVRMDAIALMVIVAFVLSGTRR